jgi:6-phosphofructokinase 1
MKRIGVLTSGGDAPGMNAAIRAVVRTSIYNDIEVFGIKHGYSGLIDKDILPMTVYSVADIIQRGGTILNTSRCKFFMTEAGRKQGVAVLKEFGIDVLIVIGGDGSYKGALELSRLGIEVIGIPGTIDNDIGSTDYTIGFDTAVSTALDAVSKIRDTSSSHNRVNIVEVMGRNCGDIALYAGIAGGAEYIIIPEVQYDIDSVCEKILRGKERGKLHSIVIVAEGAGDFKEITEAVQQQTRVATRGTNLGYIQRGGSPTGPDRILASRMGYMAVECVKNNNTNCVISIRNNQYITIPIEDALEMKKEINLELYNIANILSI